MLNRSGGYCPLTPRELELLAGAAGGLRDRELGDRIGMARQSVRNALSNVFRKLRVPNCTGAVVLALQRGWLSLDAISTRHKASEG